MGGCLCVPTESGSSASRFVLPLSSSYTSFKLSHYFVPPSVDEQEEHRFSILFNVKLEERFVFETDSPCCHV